MRKTGSGSGSRSRSGDLDHIATPVIVVKISSFVQTIAAGSRTDLNLRMLEVRETRCSECLVVGWVNAWPGECHGGYQEEAHQSLPPSTLLHPLSPLYLFGFYPPHSSSLPSLLYRFPFPNPVPFHLSHPSHPSHITITIYALLHLTSPVYLSFLHLHFPLLPSLITFSFHSPYF